MSQRVKRSRADCSVSTSQRSILNFFGRRSATAPSPIGSRKGTQLPVDDTQIATSGSHAKGKRMKQENSTTIDISDGDSPAELRPSGREDTSTSAGLECRREALTSATTRGREDYHDALSICIAEGSDQSEGERGTVAENVTKLRPRRKCELRQGMGETVESSGRMKKMSGASRVAADEFEEGRSAVRNGGGGEMEEDTVGSEETPDEDEGTAVGDKENRGSETATGDEVVQPGGHRSNGEVNIEVLAENETTSGVCDTVKQLENESDVGVSEYELQRLERIKKNQAFMDALGLGAAMPVVSLTGISSGGGHSGVKKRKKSARPAEDRVAREPARRSIRTRRNKPMYASEVNQDPLFVSPPSAPAPELEPQPALEEIDFDDSTVLKYLCGETDRDQAKNGYDAGSSAAQEGARVVSVRPLGRDPPLSASGLSTIYSMHFRGGGGDSDGTNASSALLAAGGKGGVVAIFSTWQPLRSSAVGSPGSRSESFQDEENDERTLMNFKAHNGWVSSVRFVGGGSGRDSGVGASAIRACRLLSSANDSVVKLWDASKALRGMPRLLCTANDLHPTRKGIFSMDSAGTRVVTGSKDATVGVASLRPTELAAERVLGEPGGSGNFHTRVIKGVSLRDETTVASCGDDSSVCVSDLRASNSSGVSYRLNDVHDGSCHTVRWHPRDENLLLTAGLDSTMKLFDLRRPDAPLHVFRGHCTDAFGSASPRRPKAIHRPEFISSGKANFNIITCGDRSAKLSMYDASSGAAVSQGTLRDEASSLAVLGGDGSEVETIAAAMPGGDVLLLAPAWTADSA